MTKAQLWWGVGGLVFMVLVSAIYCTRIIDALADKHDVASFSTLQCNPGVIPGSRSTATQSHWEKERFVIETAVTINCANSVAGASAKVIGSYLILSIPVIRPPNGILAGCMCEQPVRLRIDTLPKRDYTIKVW